MLCPLVLGLQGTGHLAGLRVGRAGAVELLPGGRGSMYGGKTFGHVEIFQLNIQSIIQSIIFYVPDN